MNFDNNQLDLLKAIVKVELKKPEISIIYHLLKQEQTTVTKTYTEIAKEIKMPQGNVSREIKKLVDKNVIGKRSNGIYVKSIASWKLPKANKDDIKQGVNK